MEDAELLALSTRIGNAIREIIGEKHADVGVLTLMARAGGNTAIHVTNLPTQQLVDGLIRFYSGHYSAEYERELPKPD